MIKLYSVDDPDLQEDLTAIQKRIDEIEGALHEEGNQDVTNRAGTTDIGVGRRLTCGCCCAAHCLVTFHNIGGSRSISLPTTELAVFHVGDLGATKDLDAEERIEDTLDDDTISSLIWSLKLNLD